MDYGFVFDPKFDFDHSISGTDGGASYASDGHWFRFGKFRINIVIVANMGCGAGVEVP